MCDFGIFHLDVHIGGHPFMSLFSVKTGLPAYRGIWESGERRFGTVAISRAGAGVGVGGEGYFNH